MPRIDIDTINFEHRLLGGDARQARAAGGDRGRDETAPIGRNPSEVFLIEGHTDAVGADVDNLSLSDRRAESVAVVLTDSFQVPAREPDHAGLWRATPEGADRCGLERQNRRVTVRRITPLLAGEN